MSVAYFLFIDAASHINARIVFNNGVINDGY